MKHKCKRKMENDQGQPVIRQYYGGKKDCSPPALREGYLEELPCRSNRVTKLAQDNILQRNRYGCGGTDKASGVNR